VQKFAILSAMLTYLRYTLATFCFAASVGCLALGKVDYFEWCLDISKPTELIITLDSGMANLELYTAGASAPTSCRPEGVPLLLLTAILALVGAASLRLGRRFTLRLAIIATTVVAGLLGMAVAI
jgi:hypothetical protein